jgi:hypothetical protein
MSEVLLCIHEYRGLQIRDCHSARDSCNLLRLFSGTSELALSHMARPSVMLATTTIDAEIVFVFWTGADDRARATINN